MEGSLQRDSILGIPYFNIRYYITSLAHQEFSIPPIEIWLRFHDSRAKIKVVSLLRVHMVPQSCKRPP